MVQVGLQQDVCHTCEMVKAGVLWPVALFCATVHQSVHVTQISFVQPMAGRGLLHDKRGCVLFLVGDFLDGSPSCFGGSSGFMRQIVGFWVCSERNQRLFKD